jgi:hypothetical protein
MAGNRPIDTRARREHDDAKKAGATKVAPARNLAGLSWNYDCPLNICENRELRSRRNDG